MQRKLRRKSPPRPVVGGSWEGFVGEQLRAAVGTGAGVHHYRTAKRLEIHYIVEHPQLGRLTVDVKRSNAPSLSRAFYTAISGVKPDRVIVVTPGAPRHERKEGIEVMGLGEAVEEITGL